MPFKKFEIKPGNEIRGFMIRLYPSKDVEVDLISLEKNMRYAWNFLVSTTTNSIEANKAFAIKNKLVSERPIVPDYNGLTPEESKIAKENFISAIKKWNKEVYDVTKNIPECSIRKMKEWMAHFHMKNDYQFLQLVIKWYFQDRNLPLPEIFPHAYTLQALAKNYMTHIDGQRRKKFRREQDHMPLQSRSGECFKLGNFGKRGGNESFYNCQISFNGLKIPGRLPGKNPEGRILEGVSIVKKADGWWASIKLEVPKRILPEPIPNTTIGIDVGLDNIAALSPKKNDNHPAYDSIPKLIENNRGAYFAALIAYKQKQKLPIGRIQLQESRNTMHIIYNEILKPLAKIEQIKIEKLSSKIGQMGSNKMSVMRKISSLLKERYNERVREVECAYTSQDCSQCGERSKKSWSYQNGAIGKCPFCEYEDHRDINAARNVAAKDVISLDS